MYSSSSSSRPYINSSNNKYEFYQLKRAICQFSNGPSKNQDGTRRQSYIDNGYAILTEYPDKTIISLDLFNLPPGVHGFHIHEFGDFRKGCDSTGSHYNPFNKTHGGLNQPNNHLGDLGNIIVDSTGRCNSEIMVNYLPLNGPYNVIGRSMVIHTGPDDMGLGDHDDSKTSGHSGSRISCGIIGYL